MVIRCKQSPQAQVQQQVLVDCTVSNICPMQIFPSTQGSKKLISPSVPKILFYNADINVSAEYSAVFLNITSPSVKNDNSVKNVLEM